MRADVVRAYVRELLERMTGERPVPDEDGDLPIRHRGGSFYVRTVEASDPYVQVFSVAVADVDPSPDLLRALNDINADLRFARTFHVRGQVLFEAEIWGTDINPANVEHACWNVATATDRYGLDLAERFGGRALFHETRVDEPSTGVALTGLYL